jgi:GxxExxY protein
VNNLHYIPLSDRENWLAGQILDIAIKIHKAVGPGLLESIYEKCFIQDLESRKIPFESQKRLDIIYDDVLMEAGLRLDILIDDKIIVEIKAQDEYHRVWEAQLLSYLKLSGKRLGYILNFHSPLMKQGVRRLIL